MRGFGLTIEPLAGGAVRVALRGELDLEHAYTFDEELRRVEGERPPCLVLDLKGLSFMDSCAASGASSRVSTTGGGGRPPASPPCRRISILIPSRSRPRPRPRARPSPRPSPGRSAGARFGG